MQFNHLHVHSHYSLLEALPKISDIIERAKQDNQTALAITDFGNMYAAIEFFKECKSAGITSIIATEMFVAPRTMADKEYGVDDQTTRIVLIATNDAGYRNLVHIVSTAHLTGFFNTPRADIALLTKHSEGIIAIIPTYGGVISYGINNTDIDHAAHALTPFTKIYGENLYLEYAYHPGVYNNATVLKNIIALGKKVNVPLVASREVYYLDQDDAVAKALVVHIKNNTQLTTEDEDSSEDFSFMTQADAEKAFKDVPDAVANIQKIIDACTFQMQLGKWVFPNYPKEDGKDYDTMLKEKAYREAPMRGVELTDKIRERLDYELSVIAKKGYSPYFLVVSDLMRHAREAKILTNTRGSAAGSFVSYVTGITTVNPVEYGLPFERFLNPERPSAPDIDMDVADDKRDEFIEYARQKYGNDHVAQIGTFGTMAARAAVKDVARALGHPYSVGDRISKMIPFGAQGFPMTIDKAMEQEQELADLFKKDPVVRQILSLGKKIEGNARHMGVHAAGVVMAPTEVTDFTPIQLDPKGGKIITQYDMYSIEDAGLLKFDFLGLKNLSVLADSIKRVKKIQNIDIDIHAISLDDQKTFKMLSTGRTMGVFQFASSGMTKYLTELQPTRVDDLNAMVALYRPGPMEFIPEYIARKRDPSRVVFLDPRLKEILEKSYGIITYQDDVLMIAINLAGYSWLDADKFRKAMGKKIPEEMAAQKDKFMSGCRERGMKELVIQKLWEQIETFAAYGFNKSHAASYGNLAYKTAYMKANYPLEYMSALLTADSGDIEKIAEIVAECKAMKIEVLPPDVNESYEVFSVVTETGKQSIDPSQPAEPKTIRGTIRFGLISIKNFGEGIAHTIVEERKKNGPFKTLEEFLTRITDKNLNKKSLESLIKSGAMESFGERGKLLANVEAMTTFHREVHTVSLQDSLFGATTATLVLKDYPPTSLTEKLVWEKELLGLYVSGHPLDAHKAKLAGKPTIFDTKHRMHAGISTVIAGLVEDVRTILTKKGDKMAFVKMGDYTDHIESVFFPEAFAEAKDILAPGTCIMIKGKVSNRNDEKSFMADAAKKL